MEVRVLIFSLASIFSHSEALVNLTVQEEGNCGESTNLTCYETSPFSNNGEFRLYYLNRSLMRIEILRRPEDKDKYTETRDENSYTLTIHNMSISDEGNYRCYTSNEFSEFVTLNIQCKASDAVVEVTRMKKVVITVDKLYPASPSFIVSFSKEKSAITVSGSKLCSHSKLYPGYYRCTWNSSNSLADGSYEYSLIVKTITSSDPLNGSFIIVSPQNPVISNTTRLPDTREVIDSNEGQPLTIQCTSRGGNPTPTVVWYSNSIASSNEMASTNTGSLLSDGTYIVTLEHTFTPNASDDRRTLICRTFYPEADSAHTGSKNKSIILYLKLKPRQPTVTQTSAVSAGDTVEIRCETSGCRPVANISWIYQGSTVTSELSTTLDSVTETYTVVSLFKRQVTASDNGVNVQCVVTHPALISPSERTESINLNVTFGPSSSNISGNKEMVATGNTPLTLTCTTGSSNPASDITWKNGSALLTSNRTYTNSTEENNGVVRSQQLVLYPTRYMDGNNISCTVSNAVSLSDVVDAIVLNLNYSPLITITDQQQITVLEGESKELTCKVDSKPPATIQWYYDTSLVLQETPAGNILNYTLSQVNRTHYGNYTCKASNGIGLEDEQNISITVNFKPLTATITGNINIIANGNNSLSLWCTSGSSYPNADIIWSANDVECNVMDKENLTHINGKYGGMKTQKELKRTPTRDNDGDVISCGAFNYLGRSEKDEVILDLRYNPLIKPMSDVIVVEGDTTELICEASSNPASTFKWYRQGQSGILKQWNGTLENNNLTYMINTVKRSDAATYRCNADNGIELADNATVLVTVHYPPVVKVIASNTTVGAISTILTCNAAGVPNSNYKYGKWIQTWPGYNIPVSERPGFINLVLNNLTYEHSGIYTCSVSNGIKLFGTTMEFMEGSVYLLVRSFPIIIHVQEKTPGKLGESVTVEVSYYSNVAGSTVKVSRNVNSIKRAVDFLNISETSIDVDLPVFRQIIKTAGTMARITIDIQSKEAFGYYDVVVSNDIGLSRTRPFEVVPKGPPSQPYGITVDNIEQKTARLSWICGFHGGFPQKIVIQLSSDQMQWRSFTKDCDYAETENPMSFVFTNLNDSQTYHVRMYSFNIEGNSTFSEKHSFTTTGFSEVQGTGPALLAGAVGGSILFVVIVVVLVKRNVITKVRGRQDNSSGNGRDGRDDRDGERDGILPHVNEDIHLSSQDGERHVYDVMKFGKKSTAGRPNPYENVPLGGFASPKGRGKGTVNKDDNRTYDNIKMVPMVTHGK